MWWSLFYLLSKRSCAIPLHRREERGVGSMGGGVGVGIQPLQILRRRLSPESPAASQISSLLERPAPFPG